MSAVRDELIRLVNYVVVSPSVRELPVEGEYLIGSISFTSREGLPYENWFKVTLQPKSDDVDLSELHEVPVRYYQLNTGQTGSGRFLVRDGEAMTMFTGGHAAYYITVD